LIESKNFNKLASEISRLSKWLQKHQDETVNDGQKAKLLSTVQSYYKLALSRPDECVFKEKVSVLCEDICKLPEGKLVAGKSSKSKVMKWIEDLLPGKERPVSESKSVALSENEYSEAVVVAMDEDSGETFEFEVELTASEITKFEVGELQVLVEEGDFTKLIKIS